MLGLFLFCARGPSFYAIALCLLWVATAGKPEYLHEDDVCDLPLSSSCCFFLADSSNPLLDTATDILQDSSQWAINNAKTAVDTARVLSQVGGF